MVKTNDRLYGGREYNIIYQKPIMKDLHAAAYKLFSDYALLRIERKKE